MSIYIFKDTSQLRLCMGNNTFMKENTQITIPFYFHNAGKAMNLS